jgi:signal peptidase
MKTKKNIFQILLNIFSWGFLGAFALMLIITAVSNLSVFGGYKSLIVQSGSMEPTIMTGDVVVIGKAIKYLTNDVITFNDEEGYITTHRIIEANNNVYKTKGDANREQDSESVEESQVMGKVILTVPKLGYFITFVRSGKGLIIFVFIPAFLIVIDELIKIVITAKNKKNVS